MAHRAHVLDLDGVRQRSRRQRVDRHEPGVDVGIVPPCLDQPLGLNGLSAEDSQRRCDDGDSQLAHRGSSLSLAEVLNSRCKRCASTVARGTPPATSEQRGRNGSCSALAREERSVADMGQVAANVDVWERAEIARSDQEGLCIRRRADSRRTKRRSPGTWRRRSIPSSARICLCADRRRRGADRPGSRMRIGRKLTAAGAAGRGSDRRGHLRIAGWRSRDSGSRRTAVPGRRSSSYPHQRTGCRSPTRRSTSSSSVSRSPPSGPGCHFERIFRVLRPGGRAIFEEPVRDSQLSAPYGS